MSLGESRAGQQQQSKPRLPKSYTEGQLDFLKSHLPEFERRSHGAVRGDAKKYALEQAVTFINLYGLPHEFHTLEEGDARFKEQIYNWFKNTVGRNRRKAEGKHRSVKGGSKSGIEKADTSLSPSIAWNTTNVQAHVPVPAPYNTHLDVHSSTSSPVMTTAQPNGGLVMQYGNPNLHHHNSAPVPPPTMSVSHSNTPPVPPPHQQQQPQHPMQQHPITITTQDTLRDAFLTVDPHILANMIQTFAVNQPSNTPLTPVVDALFAASTADTTSPYARDPLPFVQKFYEASRYLSQGLVHANSCGQQAALRALLMQIRRKSVLAPPLPITSSGASSSSLSEDMQRIAIERQRRKDHIQWARVHAAALETGMITGFDTAARAFSEIVARDAVWEGDEAEWLAGMFVMRALMRTAMGGDRRQRDEYAEMLGNYERRWKDIKDEVRQSMATEVLVSAKEQLDQLNDALAA